MWGFWEKYLSSLSGFMMVSNPRDKKIWTKKILNGELKIQIRKYFLSVIRVSPKPRSKNRKGIIGKNLTKKILKNPATHTRVVQKEVFYPLSREFPKANHYNLMD